VFPFVVMLLVSRPWGTWMTAVLDPAVLRDGITWALRGESLVFTLLHPGDVHCLERGLAV